jgi:hypothetical protein
MAKTKTPDPIVSDEIANSEGYKRLKAAVDEDEKKSPGFHDYTEKLIWALDRSKHYAEKTGLGQVAILDSWEKQRDYWYMNYYQDSKLPLIEGDKVKVFDVVEDLHKSVAGFGFRCPACDGASRDPYDCDSGIKKMVTKGKGKKAKLVESDEVCDWKVYGLFGDLGKGVYVFVKAEMRGQRVFKPIAWETEEERASKPKLKPLPKPEAKEPEATVPPISETSAAGFMVNDEVGYKSSLKDEEYQHVGKVHSVHPGGIPSSDEPMLMIEGKSGVVLASHCTLIKRGS